jgi:hypothetical protein
MSENVSIREIAWRQYVGRPASFFIRIVGILDLYELPILVMFPTTGIQRN